MFVQEINREIAETETRLKSEIIDQIIAAIKEVGKEGKYDLVLEDHEKYLLYSNPNYDITNTVLKKLE